MPPVVIAVATAVSAAAADTAAVLGASSAIIEGVSTLAYSLAITGITTGIATGIGAAFAPKVPDPQALQTPLKQPMPVRQSAFGRVRVGGAYAYFGTGVGTAKALSIDMVALLDGRSSAFVSYYLNDDLMAPVGDYWWAPGAPGKYGGGGSRSPNLVQIDSRLGLDTETSYSEITPALPLWDSTHRGDGVTSMALYCTPARREDQSGDFPNGVPIPSAVIDAQLVYDPRDGGQTQGDKSTYVFSDNSILCLLAYLTDANGGMGLDYARFILPAVDDWTAAADECDGLVSTSGMHATLLDAAAVGDNKIFLADTTGLAVGATVQLATENVTVSALGLAGEVDLTGDMLYAHAAGELAAWPGFGQQAAYRCAGTYSHATQPGDVVKSILSTFDGWLGQRGDGALVPRTNTVYAPTVTLGDRHIVGYQVQHYLPDEQATNQYIVSYTDPAGGFNKAEAGYVQDDIDIAARGQLRSQELYLQWVPSAPQALSVARVLLARNTQPLRGTITCNLAGLAAMGERYVKLQISELPELTDLIVEVTGKVSIDLASMTVSFPWVAASAASASPPPTPTRVQEIAAWNARSATLPSAPTDGSALVALGTGPAALPVNTADGWTLVDSHEGIVVDSGVDQVIYGVVAWKRCGSSESATQTPFSGSVTNNQDAVSIIEISDCGDLPGSLESLTWASPASPASGDTIVSATATATTASDDEIAVAMAGWWDVWPYFDTMSLSSGWGHVTDSTGAVSGSSATVVGSQSVATSGTTVTATVQTGHAFADVWYKLIVCLIVVGRYTRDSLPPLGPPSGAPLELLDAPTISSLTADYPSSGGGVSGARLLVAVSDEGDVAWKLRWKLAADTSWTEISVSDPTGSPPQLLTGLIAASGTVDVQVAYVTAAQVSPWSATSSVTVSAPVVATTTLTASETITAPALVNIWNSSGAKVRNANASAAGKEAHGFVLTSIASGASGTIYTAGEVTGLSGLTPGEQYLAATAGAVTATAPTSTGQIVQRVGFAHSSTAMTFEPGDPVIRR